ncbi:MAG: sulfatase [Deltaproteobacteria bacterium]|nr:sulfatase [Deltaproteobacteria bacterium]
MATSNASIFQLIILLVFLHIGCADDVAHPGQKVDIDSDTGPDRDTSSDLERPNFVLLLTDDQSYNLGMLGDSGLETPRIDSLAQSGVFFSHGYAMSASCAPSRGTLMTGMYPSSNGHWRNTTTPIASAPDEEFGRNSSMADEVGVHEDIPTLIEILKANGYFTGITAKFHLSPPWKFPFDFHSGATLRAPSSQNAVREFMNAATGKSFFLMANVLQTHRPYRKHIEENPNLPVVSPDEVTLPPHFPDTPKTRLDYSEYLTTIEHADVTVGAIINALRESGRFENTIFIYTSDQGYCYHRAKATAYDWGVHVPFAIAGPGIASNVISEALVGHVDVMPTVLDYADIAIPPTVQGRSLRPVLEGKAPDVGRTTIVSEHNAHGPAPDSYYPTRSITDGRFRFMWNMAYKVVPKESFDLWATAPDARTTPREPAWTCMDATPSDKWQNNAFEEIIFHKDTFPDAYQLLRQSMFRPEFELYDLHADPYETRNLAGLPEYTNDVQRLNTALKTWMKSIGDIGDPRKTPRRTQ